VPIIESEPIGARPDVLRIHLPEVSPLQGLAPEPEMRRAVRNVLLPRGLQYALPSTSRAVLLLEASAGIQADL
jgi:hypothetical protein